MKRRRFLASAAIFTAPTYIPSRAFGANDKINLGVIGCGAQGMSNLLNFLKIDDIRVVAVCDVDKFHYREHTTRHGKAYGLEPAKLAVEQHYGDNYQCDTTADFREICARKDIDAVLVATPDHWHAHATLEALRNGKDVYCEKPVTHTFTEGQAVVAEVAKQNAIFQVGSQQRSESNFRRAVNLVRNGVIGAVKKVEVGIPAGYATTNASTTPEDPPAQLDYDSWCGPSPVLPYMRARHHRWWRGHTNYGGGTLMDWIGHHNDIAHWGLGMDKSGPVSVVAENWTMSPLDVYDTPLDYTIRSKYPGGIEILVSSKNTMGTKWIGENGWVYVTRGKFEVSDKIWLAKGFSAGKFEAYQSPSHHKNFAESIRSRKPCICAAETGHRSITPGHLGYVSNQLGRILKWDAEKEIVIGDDEAQKLLTAVDYRKAW